MINSLPKFIRPGLVFVVGGEGGHFEQASRFSDRVNLVKPKCSLVITELNDAIKGNCKVAKLTNVSISTKSSSLFTNIYTILRLLLIFISSFYILLRYRPIGIVSFGPLFSIPFCILAKCLLIPTVHIETWSRFSSISRSGKNLNRICGRFYYQNESLKASLSKARFSGRL